MEATTLAWTVTSGPSGAAAPQFTTSSGTTTVKFSAAGTYILNVTQSDSSHDTISLAVSVTVVPVPTGTVSGSSITVTGTSQSLPAPSFVDQFGKPISASSGLTWTWAATTVPSSAPALKFASSNTTTTATFGKAGSYVLTAEPGSGTAAYTVGITVNQTFSSVTVTPGTATVMAGGTEQFSAVVLDQFQQGMATQPTFAWSASGGTISSAGLYTAGSTAGSYSVAAKSGAVSGSATVNVAAPSPSPGPNVGGLKDPALAALVQKLDADGLSSRTDMIQILTSVGASGSVSAADLPT